MSTRLYNISDIKILELPHFAKHNDELIAIEGEIALPMSIRRVFSVRAEQGAKRGRHAHRLCTQILVCLLGAVKVHCFDGSDCADFNLENAKDALYIPPTIWAEQDYLGTNNVLLVLCDQHYDEEDYIRSGVQYDQYRQHSGQAIKRENG